MFHNGSRPAPSRRRPWLRVEPVVGRAAFFSSGWENMHGVAEVRSGERWAMTAVFSLGKAEPSSTPEAAAFGLCAHPSGRWDYSHCRARWSTMFGYSMSVEE